MKPLLELTNNEKEITTIPSLNILFFPTDKFYVVDMNNFSIIHSGDARSYLMTLLPNYELFTIRRNKERLVYSEKLGWFESE